MLKETNPVIIVQNSESGELVQVNQNKPDYASIQFQQTVRTISNGYLNVRKRVAFLASDVNSLNDFIQSVGWKHGDEVPGRIRVEERREPFYPGQMPKINPTTGNMVMVDDAPVYYQAFWDETGNIEDIIIQGRKTIGVCIKQDNQVPIETSNT